MRGRETQSEGEKERKRGPAAPWKIRKAWCQDASRERVRRGIGECNGGENKTESDHQRPQRPTLQLGCHRNMTPISFHVTKKALLRSRTDKPGVMTLRVVNGGDVAIHDHDAWHEEGGGRESSEAPDSSPFLPTTAPLIMLLARATTPEPFAAADSHTYTSKASSEGTAPRAKPSSTVGAERFLSSSRYYMKAVR